MKHLYRPLLLVSLLATAPAVLFGCSGGSSSNRSASDTRANLTFRRLITPDEASPITTRPLKVQGVFTVTEPDNIFGRGNGIYTYGKRPIGIITAVVNTKDGVNRVLILNRSGDGSFSPTVGETYNFKDFYTQQVTYIVRRGSSDKLYSTADFGDDSSGTVTILARNGTVVTVRFNDAKLYYTLGSGTAFESFVLNGTLTYNENNLQPVPGVDSLPKSTN